MSIDSWCCGLVLLHVLLSPPTAALPIRALVGALSLIGITSTVCGRCKMLQ